MDDAFSYLRGEQNQKSSIISSSDHEIDSSATEGMPEQEEHYPTTMGTLCFYIIALAFIVTITIVAIRQYCMYHHGVNLFSRNDLRTFLIRYWTTFSSSKKKENTSNNSNNGNNDNDDSSNRTIIENSTTPRSISSTRGHAFESVLENTANTTTTTQQQVHEDRLVAEQLQYQLNAEQRETERQTKRKERQQWYDYYLQPYCMVVQKEHLLYAREEEIMDRNTNFNPRRQGRLSANRSSSSHGTTLADDDDDDDNDTTLTVKFGSCVVDENNCAVEKQIEDGSTGSTSIMTENSDEEMGECGHDDKDDVALYLKIKTNQVSCSPCSNCSDDDDDNEDSRGPLPQSSSSSSTSSSTCWSYQSRYVEGTCALCLDEYHAGDIIVISPLQHCQHHVFHKDCLFRWLAKGKKRCPICRHWFVPGAKIEDQQQAHGLKWQWALHHMEQQQQQQHDEHQLSQQEESSQHESRTIPENTNGDPNISDDTKGPLDLHSSTTTPTTQTTVPPLPSPPPPPPPKTTATTNTTEIILSQSSSSASLFMISENS